MFDKIEVRTEGSTEYVPYEKKVSITENKAPTDKSIELMNEWAEKLVKNIIGVYSTENTELDVKMVITMDKATHHQIFGVAFRINGKRREYVKRIGLYEKMNKPMKILLRELITELAEDIVKDMLADLVFKEMNATGVERW